MLESSGQSERQRLTWGRAVSEWESVMSDGYAPLHGG